MDFYLNKIYIKLLNSNSSRIKIIIKFYLIYLFKITVGVCVLLLKIKLILSSIKTFNKVYG